MSVNGKTIFYKKVMMEGYDENDLEESVSSY